MRMIGPYVLLDPPLEGGFGRVYKAYRQDQPGVFFAVKFPLDPSNADHLHRLRREAKVLGAVKHPNVLRLIEANLDATLPYLVLEYVAGGSLRERISSGLPFNVAMLVLYEIADALGAFHAKDGFHRDVKPENILVTPGGSFILADANLGNVPAPGSCITRTLAGTPGYIDPWAVNHGYDASADIWSLGVTVAETLTGKKPQEIVVEHRFALIPEELPAPTPGHRDALHALLAAMLHPKRALRPTAVEVQQYARVLVDGGQLPRLRTAAALVATAAPVGGSAAPRAPSEVAVVVATVGIVVLIAIGIAAILDS